MIASASAILESLSTEERRLFVDGLCEVVEDRSNGDDLALELLKTFSESSHATRVYRLAIANPRYETLQDESYLVSLLRVVASNGSDAEQDVVSRYLAQSPLPMYYSTLQWSFWPRRPDAFGKAYARYLTNTSHERWERSAIVQAFFGHADALQVVRRELAGTETLNHFDRALAHQLSLGIGSEVEKEAVAAVLADMA